MSRTIRFLLAALSLLIVPSFASAQYMYLDVNGDGVHTDQDVMPSSGTASVDVWLITNADRAGTTATCVTGDGSLDFFSYVVNLRAINGTVEWTGFENHVASFSVNFPTGQDSLEFQGGAGGMYRVAAGRYRVASLSIRVVSGEPAIEIVASTKFHVGGTSFGTPCSGNDWDNTMKLGSEWFDTDGLEPAGSASRLSIEPIPDVAMDENTTVLRHIAASDPDGDALTLTMPGAPWWASLGAATVAPGRIDADVTFAPTYSDAGAYTVLAAVSDGIHIRDLPFTVTVRDVNRPLVMTALPDTSVEIGSVLDLTIGAMDPDGSVTIALIEAPPFASLAGPYRLEFRPGLSDVGTYTVRVSGTCGQETLTESFRLTVTDSGLHRPPVIDPIPDVTCDEGDNFSIYAQAHSNDGGVVALRLLQGPAYVHLYVEPAAGTVYGGIWFTPGPRDSGTALVRLEASTSLYRATAEFTVHVRAKYFPPEFSTAGMCVEPAVRWWEPLWVRAPELDTVRVSTGPLPSWIEFAERFSSPGLWITTGPEDLPTTVQIDVYLNRGTPSESKWTLPVSIVGYDECPHGSGGFTGSRPIPNAGGPYAGVAGAPVQFHATATEIVPNNVYRWTFGDGHAAQGPTVAHAYAEGGTYSAMIRLGLDPLSRDTASVAIADAYPATAAPERDREPLQLSRKADYGVLMERVGEVYDLTAIDPASLCLRVVRAGRVDSVFASNTKGPELAMGDAGIQRLRVSFSASDLDRLFTGVRGRLTVEGRVQARLVNGARVRAPITLTVVGRAGERGRIAVWPNPLNPAGTISFETDRAGRVLVQIYAVSGRLVRTLHDGVREAGVFDIPFDGRNAYGETLGSGVYYYRVESPGSIRSGRLTVLK